MAHRSDDIELVRSVGSPLVDEDTSGKSLGLPDEGDGGGGGEGGGEENGELSVADNGDDDGDLPQCKIKRNYSCNLCSFFSQNPRSFLYHSRDVHFDKIKIFECSQCLYASKHSQKLQRHINMIHVAGKSKVKRASRGMKVERKKEARPIKPKPPDPVSEPPPPEPPEQSETGPPPAENVPKLDIRNDCESGEVIDGEFKCSLCNFKNKNQKLLRRHEKIVHLKKRFLRCSKCSYVTHVKARYTKHVKYHSMPMIKCDLCDFRTPYKWNLDRHYKNHCGSGAFQCSKCNFRADIKQSLTVHEMNHHVPPVGHKAASTRKKNVVGASDTALLEPEPIDGDEMELLRLEREESDPEPYQEDKPKEEEEDKEKTLNFQNLRNVKVPYSNKRESANNNHLQTDFIHPDDIVPRYGQIYVKNLKCKFCSYKAVFSHEIWRHEKRIHGYIRPENKKENAPKRPPPKLIPIQNKAISANPITSPILKIPAVRSKAALPPPEISPVDKSVNEKEFNEMCKKSSLTSSLKDFVSLIGDEEGLKTIPDSSREDLEAECLGWAPEPSEDLDTKPDLTKQKQTDLLKKKNASFFDKLKEKLMTGNSEEQSLFCEVCGHESKCLSEAVAHQKRHSNANYKSDSENHAENEIVPSGAELSSTRCQHCRQRCKTSTDLLNHLKSCKAFGAAHEFQPNLEETKVKTEEVFIEDEEKAKDDGKSMENRVFVWNDLGQRHEEEEDGEGMEVDVHSNEEFSMDAASMYGTVTSKGSDNTESGTLVMEVDPRLNLTVKKVFKCPHCSFWASTASRFHVHIVGHLNKKPFECSLCLYRSNWRWDITKHIRLKSARDPNHLEAKVNMTDETGRRNYSKYNKYLTMMKVQEPTAESSGTGRRSRPVEATQGNATENDIIPLPAPPRLTRAPTPGVSHQVPQGIPLRPPPPLKAAHQIPSLSKGQTNTSKTARDSTKKTLWKCKKCNFRDSVKDNVLAHVKEHYGKKNEEFSKNSSDGGSDSGKVVTPTSNPKPQSKTTTYKCGHCHQVSNWKHVIQRHWRLKHMGKVMIQVGKTDEQVIKSRKSGENPENVERPEDSIELISCDICPFTTDTEGDLTAHKLNHVDRPGSIFKCSYCPFYVPSKTAVLEHMEVHGVHEGCDLTLLKVDNFDPSECNEEFSKEKSTGSTGHFTKRYKCRQCPYLSNSRTQFLYHKQFHRPRGAPFKCLYCSYNVSRRHLLHQHLRVHHDQRGISKNAVALLQEKLEDPNENAGVGFGEINTVDMPQIPLVWVLKSGNFFKMYKCRWCPHVNMRKSNIQEHERMHKPDEKKKNVSDSGHPPVRVNCPDCTYTCSNVGVLASHAKVHQGFYGEIRSLVDSTRPDAEQIKELQSNGQIIEPEVVIKEEEDSGQEEAEDVDKSFQEELLKAEQSVQDEPLSSQPENAYNQTTNQDEGGEESKKVLSFCNKCPARFFFKKELRIHSKFHMIHLPFRCQYCTYTARQRPHLLAHYKVHTQEYQERTAGLIDSYAVSADSPRPGTTIVAQESYVIEGPVWIVASPENFKQGKGKGEGNQGKAAPKHACHRCPAKFFKSVALQYHLTLHGNSYQHKCKYCDYTVKTYGNLIKHQLVHQDNSKEKVSKGLKFSYSFPISGTELFERRKEAQVQSGVVKRSESTDEEFFYKKADPNFDSLMLGSPEFIYPTYIKNGKIKEKKYKCHKCPSAFEKRDQYRIHLSLHGSKQKYRCEKCDYSVKYYANYVQHMRKHQNHDDALKARKLDTTRSSESDEPISEKPAVVEPKEEPGKKHSYELTLLEQQTLLLQERKKSVDGKDEEKKSYSCRYCPYASSRRDAVDNHAKRHYRVSGVKSGFECTHCDYSATQGNFLREHNKLHFNGASRFKAEAYLKCEKMELWCSDDKTKDESRILFFQDKGEEVEERFFPPNENFDPNQEEIEWKIYVNPETGEPIGEETDGSTPQEDFGVFETDSNFQMNCEEFSFHNEDLIEMIEEQTEEVPENVVVEKVKPKVKRWRGKNWKCKKCPHAFGKRDQYMRHIALHGSNQRHNCDICDYSVKFYTNYVQHMRMHQIHEPERVIFVKKNCQSLEESASRLKDCQVASQFLGEVTGEESDSFVSQEEKPTAENDFSILAYGTENSISCPDDGQFVEAVGTADPKPGLESITISRKLSAMF